MLDEESTMAVDPGRLASVPLFGGLSSDNLGAVAAKLEEREMHVGEHLSSEGGAGYFFFVVESGTAEVVKRGEVVAELGPGDFFGEGAIFRARRRTATVTATAAGILFAMFGADFAKLAGDLPEIHMRIDAALDARMPID
jgi:CRP-like cAMP-binding protein